MACGTVAAQQVHVQQSQDGMLGEMGWVVYVCVHVLTLPGKQKQDAVGCALGASLACVD